MLERIRPRGYIESLKFETLRFGDKPLVLSR